MTFEKNIPNRRTLVQRLEALTGFTASYTQLPRCAYLIGPYTVEKDGRLNADVNESTLPILRQLLNENMIKGNLLPVSDPHMPDSNCDIHPPAVTVESEALSNSFTAMPSMTEWFFDPRCDYERRPSSPKTRQTHKINFQKQVTPFIGNKPIDQVTGEDLLEIYASMEAQGYSPNTIYGVCSMLSMIFSAAIRTGLLEKSPCPGHIYSHPKRNKIRRKKVIGRLCPFCGRRYTLPPALSRTDNRTEICPACGVREALRSVSMSEEQVEALISSMEGINNV